MKIYKQSRLCVTLACFVWSWSSLMATATWWLLNVPTPHPNQETRNSKGAKTYCNSLRYLTEKQKQFCIHHPTLLNKISYGARVGVRECEYQFQNRRWSCKPYPGRPKQHAFEPVFKNKGPERAYVKAILSAAVSYTITRACSLGELSNECMCATIKRSTLTNPQDPKIKFEWGGCSDDVRVGDQYSREFFNKKPPLSQAEVLDFHNSEAGRRAVRMSNKTTCKCHGLSGACTQNICWRSLPPLRVVGRELLIRYNTSVKVRVKKSRIQGTRSGPKPTIDDLIYLKKSPTFCKANLKRGSYGTEGRWCNVTSTSTESCDHMCCGRGYRKELELKRTSCNCKFDSCCHLTCDSCEEIVEETYCK